MSEIRTVTTLVAKRDEIERSIANYEARLEQARADLSHVNAVISIFEATGDRDTTTAYTDIHRLFQRGELVTICKAALAEHAPMNTRALVTHILAAKGLDGGDRVLARLHLLGPIFAIFAGLFAGKPLYPMTRPV